MMQQSRIMIETKTDNAFLQALRSRRSIPKVKAERPPRALVEQVIEAAAWAPNHYKTEPWRFVVLAGDARRRLGDVMAESLRARIPNPDSEEGQRLLEKERDKPLRAPVVIAVGVEPSDDPRAVEIEEIAAVAAGVENMLLAARAMGLGAMWRTGEAARDPAVKRFLGFPEEAHILSFVYLGYPDLPPLPEKERDALRHTRWLGWDEGPAGSP